MIEIIPCGDHLHKSCNIIKAEAMERGRREGTLTENLHKIRKRADAGAVIINGNRPWEFYPFELYVGENVVVKQTSDSTEKSLAIGQIVGINKKEGKFLYKVDFNSTWSRCIPKVSKVGWGHIMSKFTPDAFPRSSLYKINQQYNNKKGIGKISTVYIHAKVEDIFYLYSYKPWDRHKRRISQCPEMFIKRVVNKASLIGYR